MATKEKLTLYLPKEIIAETKHEADRQDRSLSWIMELAWRIARDRIKEFPSVKEYPLTSESDQE